MKKLKFVTGAAVRNCICGCEERKVSMKQHPLTLQHAVSFGCVACNFTGVVNNPIDPDRQVPCGCVNYREPDPTPVPTLAEAIKAKKQSCGCQTHDHRQPVSSDPASIMSNPPTIADVLKARRAS